MGFRVIVRGNLSIMVAGSNAFRQFNWAESGQCESAMPHVLPVRMNCWELIDNWFRLEDVIGVLETLMIHRRISE